jgi:hypothetical protein
MDIMDYESRIKSSPLIFKMKSISAEVFLRWLSCAGRVYGVSAGAQTMDRNEIANTFLHRFVDAAKALVENGSDKKAIHGWSFGFLCGHIQGALDVEWFNTYVIRPSNEFSDLMKIKSIIEFFRLDRAARMRLAVIYDYFLEQKAGQPDKVEHLPPNVVQLRQASQEEMRLEDLAASIADYLKITLEDNYSRILKQQRTNCCPDLTSYFDIAEVREVVGSEHFD